VKGWLLLDVNVKLAVPVPEKLGCCVSVALMDGLCVLDKTWEEVIVAVRESDASCDGVAVRVCPGDAVCESD
jgi:hypothetical protein